MDERQFAESVCGRLRDAGYQAYLVGGCVRDILLGRAPADYDVATDATPAKVLELFPQSITVGAEFGVVLAVEEAGKNAREGETRNEVEVATFRSDVGYSDGRHPDRVVYAKSPEEDARRRDFTINALLLDPATGNVLDFVGGEKDLEEGTIRAVGEPARRFREDKLRLLRAVRFASRFGYRIEEETFRAIHEVAPAIPQVSAERVRDELTKLLTEGAARRGFEMLDETGLLEILLPEVAKMKGVEQPPQFHPEGDVWTHTLLMIEQLPAGCSRTLAWAVLLHDVGKPPTFAPPVGPSGRIRFDDHVGVGTRMAEAICRRLRFSNEETQQIAALVANHLRFKDAPQMKPSTLKRFVRLNHFEEHLELHRLDCLSSHRNLQNYEYVRRFLAETPREQMRPPCLLTGDDLQDMGFRPGPPFKVILHAVEEAQLNGEIGTPEEAREYVREHYLENGSRK